MYNPGQGVPTGQVTEKIVTFFTWISALFVVCNLQFLTIIKLLYLILQA